MSFSPIFLFFFFAYTSTTQIYTLSLHDALPISRSGALPRPPRRPSWPRAVAACPPRGRGGARRSPRGMRGRSAGTPGPRPSGDRKSTRLNSSHTVISYAVFCLKKKKKDDDSVHV